MFDPCDYTVCKVEMYLLVIIPLCVGIQILLWWVERKRKLGDKIIMMCCPDCGHMLVFINEHRLFCCYCVKSWYAEYNKKAP